MEVNDPILAFLSNRTMVRLSAVFEIALIALLFSRINRIAKIRIVAATGAVFLAYHLAVWLSDYALPCTCLGGMFSALGINGKTSTNFAFGWSALMFVGGSILLVSPKYSGFYVKQPLPS